MNWKNKLKKSITTLSQLKKYIDLPPEEENRLKKVIQTHPMRISRYYISLIDRKNPDDPIRKMIVPSRQELDLAGSYDTSGEQQSTKMPGLQHMYPQTALILATNRCPAYCRYCFRKRLIGLPTEEILQRIDNAVKYIKKHTEINNVLISGGDPFVLSTGVIKRLLDKLSRIAHLSFIRFGTRTPVIFPDRILKDNHLLKLLKDTSSTKKKVYIVTQFNHPNEITEKSRKTVDLLVGSGMVVNNQTVLLKGVNDNPQTLKTLQKKIIAIGVNPYYVFQCRPVKRIKKNFQVPLQKAYRIIEETKKGLDGHSKRFKYVMSHCSGKVEIVGILKNHIYFKYHQSKKAQNTGKFFRKRINKTAGWLDEL